MTAHAFGGSGNGLPSTIVSKTANYTATVGDFVEGDTSGGNFTVTLPSNPSAGALVAVKKISSDSHTLTIAPSGSGNIDGDATATTSTQWAGAVFEHKGSDVWRIATSMTTYGPAGQTGVPGPTGATGPTGPQGPAGAPTPVLPTGKYSLLGIDGTFAALTLNQEYSFPLLLPGQGTLDTIALRVASPGSTGAVIRVGIRADSSGSPGSIVTETATPLDSTGNGWKSWTLSPNYTFNGQFWLSFVGQVSASSIGASADQSYFVPSAGGARSALDWSTGHGPRCAIGTGVTGTLAAAATPAAPTTNQFGTNWPSVAIRRVT